jgi:sugar/nucleoside kinase (ribokinase family)
MPENRHTRITGIGNVLVDILINETDQFLEDLGKEKGGMTLVEDADIEHVLSKTRQTPSVVPGGACCNTIVGVGNLGGETRFAGSRGDDAYGRLFEEQVIKCSVEPRLSLGSAATGKVVSVITPDAQRSMFTCLGASTELAPDSVTPDIFKDTAIAMVEGYLLFNRDLMTAALKAAKAANAKIALDLASFEVVNASKDILDDLITEYVDILIANEDEAKAYTGESDEDRALEHLSRNVEYAVLKVGARGSYISHNKAVTRIAPVAGDVPKDTTGAGDLWAAGFLYGLAHGFSVEKSGQLGSACGYAVCQVIGAQIPDTAWEKIRTQFNIS